MPAKNAVIGFLVGIGVAVVIGGRFWASGAGDSPAPIPVELESVAEAAGEPGPVDGAETLVAQAEKDVEPSVETPPEPATPAVAHNVPAPRPVAAPITEPIVEPEREAEPEPREVFAERAERGNVEPEERFEGIERDDEWARSEPWPAEQTELDTIEGDIEDTDPPVSAAIFDRRASPQAWEPAPPIFEELILTANSVISLQIDSSISTETARIEDRVEARTIRDVKVGSETAIPAGSLAIGSVTLVEQGGKIKERSKLGLRFHTIVLDDGSEVALQTETIYREGRSPGKESAAKIGGGATVGAILGGIFVGRRGAVIGGAIGAGGGTAATMAGGRNPATLPAGTPVAIRLQAPARVTVER